MQIINLDMSGKERAPLLHAKQGDVGRRFLVTLTDNGGAYDVPDGAKVSVWYSGASGTGNYTDIGEESAVTVSGNEILVELIAQMLLNPGAGFLCLVLHTSQGEELGCWNIPYYVEARPGMNSAEAQAYFTAFSKAGDNQLERVALSMDVRGCRSREQMATRPRRELTILMVPRGRRGSRGKPENLPTKFGWMQAIPDRRRRSLHR